MNYLVHFLLAGDDDELRLGNLLGDFVKGRVERFDHRGTTERLRTGIQMHRTIDAFSDRHPAVRRSKEILAPTYGRLSGVIVDVFYDHVLARRWSEHHAEPLSAFTQDVYRTLRDNLHRMPAAVHPMIVAMSHGDWLRGYASRRGIDRALQGMAARRPVAAKIGTAGALLSDHFDRFSADFDELLPDLRARCSEFLAERAAPGQAEARSTHQRRVAVVSQDTRGS
jgi:acyl carrier protein phosphodiesterase